MPQPSERLPIAHAPISVALLATKGNADLPAIIQRWATYLDALNRAYEILAIHAGDNSHAATLVELSAANTRIKVIRQQETGVGGLIRAALTASEYPLFFYGECTDAYSPMDLKKLLEVIDHVDLVTGFRIWSGNRPRRSVRDFFFQLTLRVIFGLRLQDVDCPYKLFRKNIFSRIPIQSDGPFAHAEILAKANFLGCLMAEVEVAYAPQTVEQIAADASGQRRREALLVFRQPDFGPVAIADPQPTAADQVVDRPPA